MNPKLCLRVCGLYQELVTRAINELGYPWVRVEAYTLACSHPQSLNQPVEQLFFAPPPDCTEVLVLGACALSRSAAKQVPKQVGRLVQLEHCLTMVAGEEVWASEVRTGAYLMTPSWLAGWQAQLQRWGFDQAGAR
ncbi:MAG: hypothetical protein WCP31_07790, partial [Chloroflexales bacterium]